MAEIKSDPPHHRQIRSFLIHKPLQREYTLLMIGMMMATVLIVVSTINLTMKQSLFGNPYRVGSTSPYELLSDMRQQLVMRVSLIFLIATLVATVIGVLFLHRVAGPVHRFRLLLKRLASDDIPADIRLRQNDYFSEVALEFNSVFKSLRQKKMLGKEITTVLDQISTESLTPQAKSALQNVRERLQKL